MSELKVQLFGLLTVATGFAIGVGVAQILPAPKSDLIGVDILRMGLFGCVGAVVFPTVLVAAAILSK